MTALNLKHTGWYQWSKIHTFTTIPVGTCLSTTQLLVLLVACPPGPDPLTNCSSSSSSLRTGRSIRSFLPATRTNVSPAGGGLNTEKILVEPLHMTRLDRQLMRGKSLDMSLNWQQISTLTVRGRFSNVRDTCPRSPGQKLTLLHWEHKNLRGISCMCSHTWPMKRIMFLFHFEITRRSLLFL